MQAAKKQQSKEGIKIRAIVNFEPTVLLNLFIKQF